jgi:N-acetylmuramoyl-L-alanine amidase
MKKILSIGLVFCLIFSLLLAMPIKAQALNDLEFLTGGTASKITYSQVNNAEEIRIFASSVQIVKQFVIAPEGSYINYRLGFEIAGVSVPRTVRYDVNKGTVVQIRLANLSDPNRASVVVETNKKPEYTLVPSSDGKSVVLTIKGNSTTAPSATPTPSSTPKPSTTPTSTPMPSVTPKPSNTPIPATSTPNTGTGTSINPTNPGPIKSNGPLSWSLSGDTCTVTLNNISLTQSTIGNAPRFEVREKEKIIQITIPGKDTRFTNGLLTGNSVIYGILVNYSEKASSTIIRISYPNTITYTHAVSNGSSVINIKRGSTSVPVTSTPKPLPSSTPLPSNTPVPSNTPTPSSTPSGSLNFAPGSAMTNVAAGGSSEVALRLVGQGIVSRYRLYSSDIKIDDSAANSTFAFVIPRAIIDIGNGTAYTEDGLTKSVVSVTTQENSYLLLNKIDPNKRFKIIENGSDELKIVVDTGTSTGSTTTRLVVLDPGHGGSDPGATVGSYYEKHYNLDIALRCQAILKSKGINVVMTRTTDVFVSLDDRAKFANDRSASLFVSIHNNIMPTGYKGSMVMYYPSSYDGKAYAQLMQNNLVKDLQTGNIGIKGDGDLVVIKKTKMPAVLAEVACMSDAGDMAMLNTDAFIQQAAQSLANSIIQIMSTR